MGIDTNTLRFLDYASSVGVNYRKTATLGRQQFMGVRPSSLEKVLGERASRGGSTPFTMDAGGYCESLFRALGAELIDSFDASDYEGASQLWDMNEPAPASAREQYSAVFDGGTLEHVFDFPGALHGALSMIAKGGHYLSVTPSHGWFGHGFYQFSPELFFQLFQPHNGFALKCVLLVDDQSGSDFYQVASASSEGKRHKFASLTPASLCLVAERVGELPPKLTLQQSDYQSAWDDQAVRPGLDYFKEVSLANLAKARLRRWLKSRFLALGGNPYFDRSIFTRLKF